MFWVWLRTQKASVEGTAFICGRKTCDEVLRVDFTDKHQSTSSPLKYWKLHSLQICYLNTGRASARIVVEMASHPTKRFLFNHTTPFSRPLKVPVQSHNFFLDQRSRKSHCVTS